MKRTIAVVPYADRWGAEFNSIAAGLRQALGTLALRIDHIGSTSVPGLDAKDIIDLQVTVASLEPVQPLIAAFAGAGFSWTERVLRDHLPPGTEGSPSEWEKLYFQPPDEHRIHVHVRALGRTNQRYALLFRDYLRVHPLAAGAYAEVKRALARHDSADWDFYYDIKDPVCDIVIVGAEEWAAGTGWEPGPTDA